jgi:hypothetical protein
VSYDGILEGYDELESSSRGCCDRRDGNTVWIDGTGTTATFVPQLSEKKKIKSTIRSQRQYTHLRPSAQGQGSSLYDCSSESKVRVSIAQVEIYCIVTYVKYSESLMIIPPQDGYSSVLSIPYSESHVRPTGSLHVRSSPLPPLRNPNLHCNFVCNQLTDTIYALIYYSINRQKKKVFPR